MPHCACFIQISGQSACGTAKYPQTARYAHKTDLTSAARARAHRNPPIWARTASWDASPQPSITNGRISRGDCAQRSSRSATSLPEHEQTERRLGAAESSACRVERGTQIIRIWACQPRDDVWLSRDERPLAGLWARPCIRSRVWPLCKASGDDGAPWMKGSQNCMKGVQNEPA